ncbi:anti-sigma factor [Actinoplanes sp. LDG1-06]|uniref:Anti-sigma factor n=1 Tax=Paractinoplanes ovalisporus TaxID=2810368 RepID=A0ABS2A765_9ACTN|nr:anti-sigma factor [Actinoplanes ovalisporus]MBM2615096.1 anti-sigma factor [Actinoplanes ovalisporus]
MRHLDPDRLVLLALSDEPRDPGESEHLAGCADCRHELDAFRGVAGLGSEAQDLRDLPPPPEHVWRAIEAGIVSPVRARTRRRRPRWVTTAVIAAAAAVVAVAGTVVVERVVDRSAAEQVTARATLKPLATVPADAGGSVRVLADGKMSIDVRNLPLTTGFHEVWLIDPDDLSRMVALGSLTDRPDAVLPVPPGTDLNRYRLVDISDEPHDGDAAHSGRSLLRGTLTS